MESMLKHRILRGTIEDFNEEGKPDSRFVFTRARDDVDDEECIAVVLQGPMITQCALEIISGFMEAISDCVTDIEAPVHLISPADDEQWQRQLGHSGPRLSNEVIKAYSQVLETKAWLVATKKLSPLLWRPFLGETCSLAPARMDPKTEFHIRISSSQLICAHRFL
jgi:hypothetical protein